jgi:ribose-phosphate pyrophosphokinase
VTDTDPLAVVAGSASGALGASVARTLGSSPVPLATARFPDGELDVALGAPVRGRRLYVIQSLRPPMGEHLLELALIADAAWRGGAAAVTAIIPYLGYARQDRRSSEGAPVGAAAVARLLGSCRLDRVVAVDLHSPPIEGYFACPVENVSAEPLLAEAARALAAGSDVPGVVVAPDLGAAKLARRYARRLGLPLAVVHKARIDARAVAAEQLVGDVRDRRALIVDDLISTGRTIAAAASAAIAAGARPEVVVAATHGVLVPGWDAVLGALEVEALFVTDSLEHGEGGGAGRAALTRLPLAPLLSEVIRRLDEGRPLSDLLART